MNMDQIVFGEYPRYSNIRGGNDTSYVTVERVETEIDPAAARMYQFCQRLKEDMKSGKQLFSENWDYFYSLYTGRQWVSPGRRRPLKEARLPPWRAQLVINKILPAIDQEVSTIFDNNPKPFLSATSPEQSDRVALMQSGLDQVWAEENIQDKMALAYQDAKIYGTAVLKFVWDPNADNGLGAIRCLNVPIENFHVDRNATSLHRGEFTHVGECSQMPVSVVKRMYPKFAHLLRPDGNSLPYQEKKETGGFGNMGLDGPSMLIAPGATANVKEYSGAAPFQTALQGEDYLIEVWELWLEDKSDEVVQEQKRIGVTPWGVPLFTTVSRTQSAYPNGRLVTFGGGVVLQDVKSPYKRPPYVLMRDIVMSKRFWGMGTVELVADLQQELNKRRSQMMDSANRMGNPVWVVDEESGVDPNMDINEPGQVVSKRANTNVQRLAPVDIPGWVVEMMNIPGRDILDITGVQQGNPTAGKRSGTAVTEAISQATVRTRRKASQVDIAIKDAARILIEMIQMFWTTPRWVRTLGTYGQATPVPFDFRQAQGQWDIKVESGSAAAASKLARRQEAIQLFNMKVIGPYHLLDAMDWPNRAQIAKEMGFWSGSHPAQYQGWPGFPDPRSNNNGYSMAARYQFPLPPPPPQGGPGGPGAVGGPAKPSRPKKNAGAGKSASSPSFPFGKPMGVKV